ncbi:thiol:disulfide interchange protein DsbA/DsbL [Pseudomethylobacillus aquaticus]
MMRNILAGLLLILSSHVMAGGVSNNQFKPTMENIPALNASKIEVIELFWYGCPHCYQLEPTLEAWVKKLPADVSFRRVPGIPRADWEPMARTYYAMEALKLTDKLHGKLFEAIHKQKAFDPRDKNAAIAWLTKESGLDTKKVEGAYNSFSNNTEISKALKIFRSSGATGVPSLIIDGKYVSSTTIAGGNLELIEVADYLIAETRKERAAGK